MNIQPGWIEGASFSNATRGQPSNPHYDLTAETVSMDPELRYMPGKDFTYGNTAYNVIPSGPQPLQSGDGTGYSSYHSSMDQWHLPETISTSNRLEQRMPVPQQAPGPPDPLMALVEDSDGVFPFDIDESFDVFGKQLFEHPQGAEVEDVTDEVGWKNDNFGDGQRQFPYTSRKSPCRSLGYSLSQSLMLTFSLIT